MPRRDRRRETVEATASYCREVYEREDSVSRRLGHNSTSVRHRVEQLVSQGRLRTLDAELPGDGLQ